MVEQELKRKSYKLVELPQVTGLSLNFWRDRHRNGEIATCYAEGAVVILAEDLEAYLKSLPRQRKGKQQEASAEAA